MPERELKLEAPPTFRLPSLDGLGDGVVASRPVERRLQTVYWDTADLRLARWGCSLRHRRGEGWTVKLPSANGGAGSTGSRHTPEGDALLVREELTYPGDPETPADQAVDLLRAYIRNDALRPVATLRTRRIAVSISGAEGEEQAEVVDDEVSVLDGRHIALRFRQLEVEVRGTVSTSLLDGIVARLREAGAGAADPTSKQTRALGPRSQEPPEVEPEPLGDDAPAAAVVRRAIAAAVSRLLRNDPGVRLGEDPEAVHQARVATRRLRSDLRTFRSLLDETWSEPLHLELGWLAHLLGDVRDRDVMFERLSGRLSADAERRAAAPLLRRVRTERDGARTALLEGMRSDRYVELLERLVSAARHPVLAPAASRPAHTLPRLAVRPWEKLRTAVERLGPAPADEELHGVRIAAKRARYAAEAVAPVAGRRAAEFAEAAAELQTVLGDLHDATVSEAWLREAATSLPPGAAFVAGELVERERADAAEGRAVWPSVWKHVIRRKHVDWMDE